MIKIFKKTNGWKKLNGNTNPNKHTEKCVKDKYLKGVSIIYGPIEFSKLFMVLLSFQDALMDMSIIRIVFVYYY